MKNVCFMPREGKKYSSTGYQGKKILVLGESLYGVEVNKDGVSPTKQVVDWYLEEKEKEGKTRRHRRAFNMFTNVVLGKPANYKQASCFWESVVFYNYIHATVLNVSRKSPQKEDFEKSKAAFFEILEEYQPDLIIVWGKRLWNHMPNCMPNGEKGTWSDFDILDESGGKFYYYETSNKKIPAYCIKHPSAALSYGWHDYIQEAINKA